MSKQTFTTGQVLTAAQVNSLQANDYNQTVSVKTASYTLAAADKGTRIEFNTSGSVTCTVNSGLFDAGDTLVIQNRGAGTATITAGTATVNTSASLALAQYSAGTLYFVSDSAALFFGDAAGISASIVDAKGDLIVGTADNTVGRLAVGTNGYTLVADSVETTGLKWVAPASGGGMTVIASGTLSGSTVSITSIPSTYNELWLYINGFQPAVDDTGLDIQFNTVTSGSKYQEWFANTVTITSGGNADSLSLIRASDNAVVTGAGILKLFNYNTTNSTKLGTLWSVGVDKTTTTTLLGKTASFTFNNPSSAISSLQIKTTASSFDGGAYALYGVK